MHTRAAAAAAPTCVAVGYTEGVYCDDCKQYVSGHKEIAIDPDAHIWNEGEITTTATCVVNGVRTYMCTRCGNTKDEYLGKDAGNHTGGTVIVNAVGALCYKDGYTGDTVCAGCGATLQKGEVIPKETVPHAWDQGTVTVKPTCSTVGTMLYRCTVKSCGASTEKEIPTDPDAHVFKVTVVGPTCTEGGYTLHACTLCRYGYTDAETEPRGHDWGEWTSCSETEHRRVCKNDGTHVETEAHSWNGGVVTAQATCKGPGETTYSCTVCSETKTETIPKNDHNHVGGTKTVNAVGALCYKDGYTGDTVCAGCGATLQKGEVIPKETVPHAWDQGTVTVKPTCSTVGTMLYRCTVKSCGASTEKEIPTDPDAHVFKVTVVGPTCTEGGYTLHACTLCRYGYTDAETEPRGHDWGEWTSCSETEHRRVCKNDGTHVETEAHSWDGGEITVPPTCTADGEKTYTCTVCGGISTETLPAPGHAFNEWHVTKPATTEEEGEETRECENCNETETRILPKLPAPDVMPGDVDGDGRITAGDARLALRRAVDLETYAEGSKEFLACDVDKNGTVTAGDARMILRAAVDLEDPRTW